MVHDPRKLTDEERYAKLADRVAAQNIHLLEQVIVDTSRPSRRSIDISGGVFGKLKPIQYLGKDKNHHEYYEFECECGNRPIIAKNSVMRGLTTSCGCVQSDAVSKNTHMITHGMTSTPLYGVWAGIKRRCYGETSASYANYGGRGIKMCDEWKNSFQNFNEWAYANGYIDGEKLTIDRIDNNGNYEPDNCRVVTRDIQAINTRKNTYICLDGHCFTVSVWSRITGLADSCISARIERGWSAYNILHTPSTIGRLNSTEYLAWEIGDEYLQYEVHNVSGSKVIV